MPRCFLKASIGGWQLGHHLAAGVAQPLECLRDLDHGPCRDENFAVPWASRAQGVGGIVHRRLPGGQSHACRLQVVAGRLPETLG